MSCHVIMTPNYLQLLVRIYDNIILCKFGGHSISMERGAFGTPLAVPER